MSDPNPEKLVRVVVLLPPDIVRQANALAQEDRRYWVFGKPSRAAVVRAALKFFLEHGVSQEKQIDSAVDNT
jgi:hypothetical protein